VTCFYSQPTLELPKVLNRRTDTSYERFPMMGEYLIVQTNLSSASEFWVQTSVAYPIIFKISAYVQYLYGAKTWTLRKIDENCLESLEKNEAKRTGLVTSCVGTVF
jgi:hypothetical protein